jgi:pre-mRNA cleavage complex 2 protein Pcf11
MNTLPTSHLPQRCKQCGIRFPDGDAKMQAHLDWHFRRNKQKTESSGRGAHRRWLPKAEDWIVDIASNNDAGPSTSRLDAAPGTGSSGVNKLSAEQLARYATRKVRAPQDPVKAGKPCPVCKEVFKAELEDDEWIFRNAIEVGGVVSDFAVIGVSTDVRSIMQLVGQNR